MKNIKLILLISFSIFSYQSVNAQNAYNWLKPGAMLDLLHVNTKPGTDREARLDFLNKVYFPAMREGLPGTCSIHIEGIDGERKDQHVKFSVFASQAVRDKYFLDEEQGFGMTEEAMQLWDEAKARGQVSGEKVRELFNGWDFSNFNFWKIVSATAPQPALSELRGLELDMHYLALEQELPDEKLEKQLAKKLGKLSAERSQLFLLYSDRGTRKGTYAILELHKPGQSLQKAIMDSDLKLDASLFSTYRIW